MSVRCSQERWLLCHQPCLAVGLHDVAGVPLPKTGVCPIVYNAVNQGLIWPLALQIHEVRAV